MATRPRREVFCSRLSCAVVERKWIGTEDCRIRRAAASGRSGAVRELRISNSGLKEILTPTGSTVSIVHS
jgi:hypothetical protein